MKKIFALLTAVATIGLSPFAAADLKVPSSVFELDELDEAKAKAAKDEEPLIFVVTNPGST